MKYVLVVVVLLFAGVAVASAQANSSDLEQYIEQIREWGMTEGARTQIRSVSGICSGAMILTYRRDETSGRYWPTYMSATCPKPEADPPEVARWKKMMMSESDLMVERLRPFADTDGSGFVTTEEGTQFRDLLEFGYLAAQVIEEEGATLEGIAAAAGLSPVDTEARIAEYNAIADRIIEAGAADLPEVALAD